MIQKTYCQIPAVGFDLLKGNKYVIGRRVPGWDRVVTRRGIGRDLANTVCYSQTLSSVRVWNCLSPVEAVTGSLPGIISDRLWFWAKCKCTAYARKGNDGH